MFFGLVTFAPLLCLRHHGRCGYQTKAIGEGEGEITCYILPIDCLSIAYCLPLMLICSAMMDSFFSGTSAGQLGILYLKPFHGATPTKRPAESRHLLSSASIDTASASASHEDQGPLFGKPNATGPHLGNPTLTKCITHNV